VRFAYPGYESGLRQRAAFARQFRSPGKAEGRTREAQPRSPRVRFAYPGYESGLLQRAAFARQFRSPGKAEGRTRGARRDFPG